MHLLKLDFWYASLVSDSFLSYETIGADRDGMIEFIRRVKEELNLPERQMDVRHVPPLRRKEYESALCRLLARVEIIDRNLYDLFIFYPTFIQEEIIEIIETTRWQFRLLGPTHRRKIYILDLEALKSYTTCLMNAELIALAVADFRKAMHVYFPKDDYKTIRVPLQQSLFRYLTSHCQILHIEDNLEEEMERLLERRRRQCLHVTVSPSETHGQSFFIDVHPSESDPPPRLAHIPLSKRDPSHAAPLLPASQSRTCLVCDKRLSVLLHVQSSPKRQRDAFEDESRVLSSKKRRRESPEPLAQSHPRCSSVLSFHNDEHDSDSGHPQSDDESFCSNESEEQSDWDGSDLTLVSDSSHPDIAEPDPTPSLLPPCQPSPVGPLVTIPRINSWWSAFRDIFHIFAS